MNEQYEVLSPWATADPVPLKGLAPRLEDLDGSKIGLFRNSKRAAQPIFSVLEEKLKEKYSTLQTSTFIFLPNDEIEMSNDLSRYEEWLKEIDAVIFAYGD